MSQAARDPDNAADPDCPSDFVSLYRHAVPALLAWTHLHVRGPLKRRLDPEDIVQEVCFRAFRAFADFDPARASFRTWVFGIAHNVLREALRTRSARGESVFAAVATDAPRGLDAVPEEATGVSTLLAQEEGFRTFLERVESLDDDDKRMLLYRGLEQHSHEHIAEVLGISVDSSQKRWQRLCRKLGKQGIPDGLLPG
ncbi:MAG: RNA polymerase sigma factor [Planctomycetota bacterium]